MSQGMFLWTRKQTGETAVTATGSSPAFETSRVKYATLDITVTAITAGTDPTLQFFVDRQGNNGVWYEVANSALLTAVGTVSLDITPDQTDGANAQHMIFTDQARVRWVLAGTVAPTSVAFSGSMYGRS